MQPPKEPAELEYCGLLWYELHSQEPLVLQAAGDIIAQVRGVLIVDAKGI